MSEIIITCGDTRLRVRPRDTKTAKAIIAALPFASQAQTWGDEVYFRVPVDTPLEHDAKDVINAGEIAYWVEGSCIAIGFGQTPVSRGDEIRLAAPTNIWADAIDDVKILSTVNSSDPVTVELS